MSDKRIFFALWPDDRQRDQMRNVISPIVQTIEGTAVYRGQWHVTLAFIGDYPEHLIPELQEAAAAVPFEPFRSRFDKAEYWPRAKVAVIAPTSISPELERLVAALNNVMTDAGLEVPTRVYRPHITISQRARSFETQRLAQPALIEWTGFELVQSVFAPGGSTYHPVKQ
jgi:2'-5' RNA ligase